MRRSRRLGSWSSCLLLFLFAALLHPALAQESGVKRQASDVEGHILITDASLATFEPTGASRLKWEAAEGFELGSFEDFEQQARSLYEAGRLAEAVRAWQQAAEQAEVSGLLLQQTLALSNLSLTQQALGEWASAERSIAAAFAQLESLPTSTDQRRVRAQALDIQGKLQFSRGQPEAAIATWQQAADDYHHLNDEFGLVRTDINQAQALRVMGHYRQAQALLEETTQRLQDQPSSLVKALSLRSLGTVLRSTGDLEASTDVLQQSLAIARSLGAPQARAETLLSLGHTARLQATPAALHFIKRQRRSPASPIPKWRLNCISWASILTIRIGPSLNQWGPRLSLSSLNFRPAAPRPIPISNWLKA